MYEYLVQSKSVDKVTSMQILSLLKYPVGFRYFYIKILFLVFLYDVKILAGHR